MNNSTNATSGDIFYSDVGEAEGVIEALILSIICVVAVSANVSLWLVVLTTRDLRNESNVLILCLSLADLLVSSVSMPVSVYTIIVARWPFSRSTCTAFGYINMLTFSASVQSLGAISVNRYIKICKPSWFIDVYTYRNVLLMSVGVWAYAGILSIPPLAGWAVYSYLPNASICFCDWTTSLAYALFMIGVCFCGPCSIMTFCYISILRTFFKSRNTLRSFAKRQFSMDSVALGSPETDAGRAAAATAAFVAAAAALGASRGSDDRSDGNSSCQELLNGELERRVSTDSTVAVTDTDEAANAKPGYKSTETDRYLSVPKHSPTSSTTAVVGDSVEAKKANDLVTDHQQQVISPSQNEEVQLRSVQSNEHVDNVLQHSDNYMGTATSATHHALDLASFSFSPTEKFQNTKPVFERTCSARRPNIRSKDDLLLNSFRRASEPSPKITRDADFKFHTRRKSSPPISDFEKYLINFEQEEDRHGERDLLIIRQSSEDELITSPDSDDSLTKEKMLSKWYNVVRRISQSSADRSGPYTSKSNMGVVSKSFDSDLEKEATEIFKRQGARSSLPKEKEGVLSRCYNVLRKVSQSSADRVSLRTSKSSINVVNISYDLDPGHEAGEQVTSEHEKAARPKESVLSRCYNVLRRASQSSADKDAPRTPRTPKLSLSLVNTSFDWDLEKDDIEEGVFQGESSQNSDTVKGASESHGAKAVDKHSRLDLGVVNASFETESEKDDCESMTNRFAERALPTENFLSQSSQNSDIVRRAPQSYGTKTAEKHSRLDLGVVNASFEIESEKDDCESITNRVAERALPTENFLSQSSNSERRTSQSSVNADVTASPVLDLGVVNKSFSMDSEIGGLEGLKTRVSESAFPEVREMSQCSNNAPVSDYLHGIEITVASAAHQSTSTSIAESISNSSTERKISQSSEDEDPSIYTKSDNDVSEDCFDEDSDKNSENVTIQDTGSAVAAGNALSQNDSGLRRESQTDASEDNGGTTFESQVGVINEAFQRDSDDEIREQDLMKSENHETDNTTDSSELQEGENPNPPVLTAECQSGDFSHNGKPGFIGLNGSVGNKDPQPMPVTMPADEAALQKLPQPKQHSPALNTPAMLIEAFVNRVRRLAGLRSMLKSPKHSRHETDGVTIQATHAPSEQSYETTTYETVSNINSHHFPSSPQSEIAIGSVPNVSFSSSKHNNGSNGIVYNSGHRVLSRLRYPVHQDSLEKIEIETTTNNDLPQATPSELKSVPETDVEPSSAVSAAVINVMKSSLKSDISEYASPHAPHAISQSQKAFSSIHPSIRHTHSLSPQNSPRQRRLHRYSQYNSSPKQHSSRHSTTQRRCSLYNETHNRSLRGMAEGSSSFHDNTDPPVSDYLDGIEITVASAGQSTSTSLAESILKSSNSQLQSPNLERVIHESGRASPAIIEHAVEPPDNGENLEDFPRSSRYLSTISEDSRLSSSNLSEKRRSWDAAYSKRLGNSGRLADNKYNSEGGSGRASPLEKYFSSKLSSARRPSAISEDILTASKRRSQNEQKYLSTSLRTFRRPSSIAENNAAEHRRASRPSVSLSILDKRRKEEFQLSASLLVVVLIFIICWFPYCISMIVSIVAPSYSTRALDMPALLLGYLNSCVNPIIYGVMNKRFKAGYKKLFNTCLRPFRSKAKQNELGASARGSRPPTIIVDCSVDQRNSSQTSEVSTSSN